MPIPAFPESDVLATRQKLVLDHFHDEVRQDWDAVLSTFPHPRYELIPQLTVHDGDQAVRSYYNYTRTAFPDQDHEIIALRHSADAVIVEFWLMGTHRGYLDKIPPTGGRFRVRMTAYFVFDETETLVCERIYFDRLTMFKQLIDGLDMKRPANWLLAARCVRGLLAMSSAEPDPALTQTLPPELSDA
ncbi:ester cyclase [Mycobacterium riyadhense]|uniref:Polyketide cyclase n=1 Tax=Mycobacterium riyadhense TaxID=486698 RepID=A0A1X2D2H3_9MYCO|nr:ester cyclase [Mycobacterium riyadhense]MCV7149408.1 ester cyclase [Mycobacterium riyadhense]ORW82435.1 polyketide cyclase [Mycobacterium riyadhense]VTO97603.1 SnoaL-like polyketide cyclase [Mycobacterium riyadhense]